MLFLIVFHHESESGAWLISTYLPAAWTEPATSSAAIMRILKAWRMVRNSIVSSEGHCSSVAEAPSVCRPTWSHHLCAHPSTPTEAQRERRLRVDSGRCAVAAIGHKR